MDLQILGAFQFDNLIKARVPFLLVRTNVDIENFYGVMERIHVRNFSVVLENLEMDLILPALAERKYRKEDPIVLLDFEEGPSKIAAEKLTEQGYVNVFYALGGWKQIQKEIKEISS